MKQFVFRFDRGNAGEKGAGVGMARMLKEQFARGGLDDASSIHDVDLIAHFRDYGEIVGNKNDGGAEFLLSIADEIENLFLHGNIERGSGLVTNQQFGARDEGHRDHDALSHTAGKFVRVAVHAFFGIVNADLSESIDGTVECLFSRDTEVNFEWFDELGRDFQVGVERSHRVLEYHADAFASDFAELFLAALQEIDAIEVGGACMNAARRLRDQAKQ